MEPNAAGKPKPELTPVPCKWVRAKRLYVMNGITEDAIKKKRHTGVWREGIEWITAPDGNIMINWKAVDEWVESGGTTERSKAS